MALITTTGVSRVYQAGKVPVIALHPTDMAIERGEFICVAGPSGSGKTTLLNLLGSIDTPTNGSICIDGKDIAGLSRTGRAKFRRRTIGFVFQLFNLIPVLSIAENVEYALLLQGVAATERRGRVREALASVGLGQKLTCFPGELSGGQQQRAAVARAIVGRPPIVLADEPTGSLDSATGNELLQLFELLNRSHNITFIFSSHDPQIIARADRTIFMRDGRVQSDGLGVK